MLTGHERKWAKQKDIQMKIITWNDRILTKKKKGGKLKHTVAQRNFKQNGDAD